MFALSAGVWTDGRSGVSMVVLVNKRFRLNRLKKQLAPAPMELPYADRAVTQRVCHIVPPSSAFEDILRRMEMRTRFSPSPPNGGEGWGEGTSHNPQAKNIAQTAPHPGPLPASGARGKINCTFSDDFPAAFQDTFPLSLPALILRRHIGTEFNSLEQLRQVFNSPVFQRNVFQQRYIDRLASQAGQGFRKMNPQE
jgi:hypothetical protein